MNYKAAMLHDANLTNSWLEEMAAKELMQVEKDIRKAQDANEIEAAARKYIELGGNPGGITKTVNSYLKKNPDMDPSNFHKFREMVTRIKIKTSPETKTRKYDKKKITGTTKEGDKIEVTGQTQEQIKKQNLRRLEKEAEKVRKETEVVTSGSEEDRMKLASDILADWGYAGKKVSEKDEPAYLLYKYINRQEVDKTKVLQVLRKTIEKGKEALGGLEQASQAKTPMFPAKDEKEEEKLRSRYGTIEKRKKERQMKESLYEEMLMESYEYRGTYFWENYILSNLVRTFPEFMLEHGEKDAVEIYTELFGEKARPLFEYMIEREDALIETALYVGKGLLFEEVGERNVKQYIAEAEGAFGALSPRGANFANLLKKSRQNVGEKIAKTASGSKILGFLGGLWGKLKDLGRGVFEKVLPFLKSGFSWAKDLVTKGVSWIATNPIARIAFPAILMAGGIVGAVKLINKIRKKHGKKEMDEKEVETLKSVEQKNRQAIEKYRKKAGTKEE